LLKQPEDARSYLQELCRRSPEIATCAALANFAKHLCRDEKAVLAALQQPWSNGPVEGHVHRLKLIKRSMYGRANFDLLRLRVVSAA
jgi:transposase